MTERSWYWGGTATGDAALPAPYGAPYSDDIFSDIFQQLFTRNRANDGVVITQQTAYNGNLACTATNAAVTVADGIAMVDGKLYASDANVVLNFSGDGVWYVVVRKSTANQTVRLMLTTTLTNLDGVTWDVPIWKYTRTGGVVSTDWKASYDMRNWVLRPIKRSFGATMFGVSPHVSASEYHAGFYLLDGDPSNAKVFIDFIIPEDYISGLKVTCLAFPTLSGTANIFTLGTLYIDTIKINTTPTPLGEAEIETYCGITQSVVGESYRVITLFDIASSNMGALGISDLRYARGAYATLEVWRNGHVSDTYNGDLMVNNPRVEYAGI